MKQQQQESDTNKPCLPSSFEISVAPLIAGITGGSVSTILLHPLDLIKVRLQVNEETSSSPWLRRRGLMNTMTSVVRYEGVISLYNGISPALFASAVSWGGYFFFYEKFKTQLKERQQQERIGPLATFFASCAASTVMIALTNPLWLIKTRMQLQVTRLKATNNSAPAIDQLQYTGIINAFQTIVREEGPAALYKGVLPALILTSLGGIQIVTYEFLKFHFGAYVTSTRDTAAGSNLKVRTVAERFHDSFAYLSMGALSKIFASTCTYPVQLIKTRLQQRSHALEISLDTGKLQVVHREYTAGILDCIQRIWTREGAGGFFKGCIPNVIRVAPNAAITFVTYEAVMDNIIGYNNRR